MAEITVVVPVYNQEKKLGRCVESIQNQTFSDWELILVDDGSTDNSGALCDQLAQQDSRILVIHQENRGYSGSKNAGIKAAKGKYIIFVDSDDWIEPKTLEAGYEGMEKHGVDLVIGGVNIRIFDGDRQVEITQGDPKKDYFFNMKDLPVAAPYIMQINATMFYCTWSKMYRMDIIRNNVLQFDENLFVQEDVKFVYCYFYHCDKCMVSKEIFYNYCRPVDKDDVAGNPLIAQYACVEQSLISFLRLAFKFKYPQEYRHTVYRMTYDHFIKLSSKMFLPSTGLSVEEQKTRMRAVADSFAFRFFCENLSDDDPFWVRMGELLSMNDHETIYREWLAKIDEGLAVACT